MKVCLSGLLSNAMSMIPELEAPEDEDDVLDDDFDIYNKYQDCPSHCPASQVIHDDMIMMGAFHKDILKQTADNVRKLCDDPSQLQAFLELYCLPSVEDYLKAVNEGKQKELVELITGNDFRRFFGESIMNIGAAVATSEVQSYVALWCGSEDLQPLTVEGMSQRQWQHLEKKFQKWQMAEAAKRELATLENETEGTGNGKV